MSKKRKMDSKSSDLSLSCRVCLQKDAVPLKSLLNPYLDSEWYPDIFLKCTSIQIIEKPEQPNWICEECDIELIRAYKFRRKCIASDVVLSAVFVKSQIFKTEEIEMVDFLIKEEETNSGNELEESANDDDLYESILLKKEDNTINVCNEDLLNIKTANLQNPPSEASRLLNPVTEEFIERVISKAFLPIHQWMTRNDTKMERLENILSLNPEIEDLDANLNIKSFKDVQKLERDLMTPEYRRKVASSLSAIGGRTENDMLRRIFKIVFPNDVLKKFSWRGTSEKLVFKDLTFIKQTICKAITNLNQFKNLTASDYDSFCKIYLRQATSISKGLK